jgi:hypothetical protein
MPEVVERTKRPVKVRTREWTGSNVEEMREFCGDDFRVGYQPSSHGPAEAAEVYDKLHDTWINVYPGQHVVCGVRGEFYPIDAAVLKETYEPAGALA